MSLWILFMSQHLNPPSALSDDCESVAWFISNGPHSATYCYKLGHNGVKAESLCPQKGPTTHWVVTLTGTAAPKNPWAQVSIVA